MQLRRLITQRFNSNGYRPPEVGAIELTGALKFIDAERDDRLDMVPFTSKHRRGHAP